MSKNRCWACGYEAEVKFESIILNQRGASFCPHCQQPTVFKGFVAKEGEGCIVAAWVGRPNLCTIVSGFAPDPGTALLQKHEPIDPTDTETVLYWMRFAPNTKVGHVIDQRVSCVSQVVIRWKDGGFIFSPPEMNVEITLNPPGKEVSKRPG